MHRFSPSHVDGLSSALIDLGRKPQQANKKFACKAEDWTPLVCFGLPKFSYVLIRGCFLLKVGIRHSLKVISIHLDSQGTNSEFDIKLNEVA